MPQLTLFKPLTLRGLTLKNRIVVSPMCQYVAVEGVAQDWHLAHLARFAIGGAAVVFVEATAVEPHGRITHGDLGLWNDEQQTALARIAGMIKALGAVPAIQLAHAGRKASAHRPFEGGGPIQPGNAKPDEPAWATLAPSAVPFAPDWPTPQAATLDDIAQIKSAFAASARRAVAAGFEIVEVHCAHGYLMTEFLSPISNRRDDAYGGGLGGRMRLPLEVVDAVREVWPHDRPVFARISAVDGTEGGWDLEDSVMFARQLKARGVDVVDCSAGGLTPSVATLPAPAPGYQIDYAAAVRSRAEVATMAVGLIVEMGQAEFALASGQADLIAMGRQMLDDPNWPLRALAEADPDLIGGPQWPAPVGYAVKALNRIKTRFGLLGKETSSF
jgi:2,4-dienoyl-CoA reductase-like NADH-dependent reductase (Old Yellow Enzyme family)